MTLENIMVNSQDSNEPVAWLCTDSIGERYLCFAKPQDTDLVLPLYATPPQRKPLGEDEAWGLIEQDSRMEEYGSVAMELIRAVERAHGIT